MSALLGLLATSVVTAIVGTALKGILRPVSWALLAGTLLLLGSVKVVEATNSVAENSPSPAGTLVAESNSASNAVGVPAAALGWQSATDGLNPAFSPLYAQQPFSPQPSNPAPSAPAASSPAANPNVFAQNPNPPASGSQSAPSARPIQALW